VGSEKTGRIYCTRRLVPIAVLYNVYDCRSLHISTQRNQIQVIQVHVQLLNDLRGRGRLARLNCEGGKTYCLAFQRLDNIHVSDISENSSPCVEHHVTQSGGLSNVGDRPVLSHAYPRELILQRPHDILPGE